MVESVINQNENILRISAGDILSLSPYNSFNNLDLNYLIWILDHEIIEPKIRIGVLNRDETLNYFIPPEDIVQNSVSYGENYTNGQRRSLSFTVVNIKEPSNSDNAGSYKYMPSVHGLWYNTKIKLEIGFEYLNQEYYFNRGIYLISGFDYEHSNSAKDITYTVADKFSIFEGSQGTIDMGYEIPADTPIEEVVRSLLNASTTDGYINDPKPCIFDSKYTGFKTPYTIRIDNGQTIANIFEELGTQMSAEYYYNNMGYLVFYPIDQSMNDAQKQIIWRYSDVSLSALSFRADSDIVNSVKVIGTNVDGRIYSAVVKNENLQSPINIYYIKERRMSPVNSSAVWSDDMAEELARYYLRDKTILMMNQSLSVPYNPTLMVNNIVEINNEELNIKRAFYVINSISYTSGSANMTLNVSNLNNLPLIGGINYG